MTLKLIALIVLACVPVLALFLGLGWAHRAGRYREREQHEKDINRRVRTAHRVRERLRRDAGFARRVRERFRR